MEGSGPPSRTPATGGGARAWGRGRRRNAPPPKPTPTAEAAPASTLTAESQSIRQKENAKLAETCPAVTMVLRQDTKDREIEARQQYMASLNQTQQGDTATNHAVRRKSTSENSQRSSTPSVMKRASQRSSRSNDRHSRRKKTASASSTPTNLTSDEGQRIEESAELAKISPAVAMVLRQDTKDRELESRQQFMESMQDNTSAGTRPNDASANFRRRKTAPLEEEEAEDGKPAAREPSELDMIKVVEQRSRSSAFADVSGLSVDNSNREATRPFSISASEQSSSGERQYSRNAKNRVSGLVQPGAYGAAPGVRPSRVKSIRNSIFSHQTAQTTSVGSDGNGNTAGAHIQEADGEPSQPRNYAREEKVNPAENKAQLAMGNTPEHAGSTLPPDEEAPPINIPNEMSARNIGLVEARQVLSEPQVSMEANELDLSAEEAKHQKQKVKLMKSMGCLCIVVLSCTLLALYFGGAMSKDKNVEVLTLVPSEMPSSSPSMAPTPLLLPLPQYTARAIEEDPHSAQSLAYLWVLNDPSFESYTNSRLIQRFALVVFYYATNGPIWEVNQHWLSYDHSECEWSTKSIGSEVCDDKGNYLSIKMTKNGLSGSLVPEVGLLTTLEVLDMAGNSVGGSIPPQIGLLTSLVDFSVDDNSLSGQVPTVLGQLSRLGNLLVNTNPLSGTVPTEIGLLTALEFFQWARTGTGGTIPTELGLLTNLMTFLLHSNELEGSIPSELFMMTALSVGFTLSDNTLTGTIPSQIGLLSNGQYFQLWNMALTGSVPTQVGQLRHATQFGTDYNQLVGTIPSEVGQMLRMEKINFCCNALTGSLPSELGLLTNTTFFDFEYNQLSSSIPSEVFQNLNKVSEFYMSGNDFTGTLPTEIGLMTDVEYMWVDDNQLTGTLPSEVGLMANAVLLGVNSNALNGELPHELGNMGSMKKLLLGVNAFTGSIPSEVGLLTNAFFLGANDNDLSGQLPPQLGNMASMERLLLGSNNFSGQIPSQLGLLGGSLDAIGFHDTELTGTVPAELCMVPELNFTCSDTLCGCYCECAIASDVAVDSNWTVTASRNHTEIP